MKYPVYCEQALTKGFFEPVNSITNFAFIIAGILLILQLKKSKQLDLKAIYFSIVLMVIGLGSLTWHLYRTDYTLIADSIPIAIFILSYLFFYLKYTAKKLWHLILLFFGFFVYTVLVSKLLNSQTIEILENGGVSYFSAISYFAVLQIYNYFFKLEVIKKSLIILLVFLSSLCFRQVDLLICEHLRFGTHFLWHILNALTLFLMVKLLYPKYSS